MIELNEFFVEGGDQERSHVLLHITEPSSPEEEAKGYFFAVAEINNGSLEQIERLQQMIDDLESGYYETDDEENKTSFEISLEYINRRGHHILQEKNSIINCIVGVLQDNQLSFSYHGLPTIKVIYSKNSQFTMMNVLAKEKNNPPNQLFSAIMQGKINPGDFFFVASPHVEDALSDDQIKKIILARKTKQASEHIQKVLGSLRNNLSYGGIIFHSPIPEKPEKDFSNLIENTVITEDLTEELMRHKIGEVEDLLQDSKLPKISRHKEKTSTSEEKEETKKRVNLEYTKKINKIETNHRPRELYEKEPLTNIILITIGRTIVSAFIGLYKLFKKIIIIIGKTFIALIVLITNKGGQRVMVIQSFNENIARKKTYIKNLPLLSKILFLLTVLLASIFIGSIGYLKIKKDLETKHQNYINKIQAISDKKTAADASMIYNDETKAFTLLKEAEDLIKDLPEKSLDEKNQIKKLETEINESLKILQKLNTVSPELIVNLADLQTSAQTTELTSINNILIAYGPDDLFMYRIDLNTNKSDKKEHGSIPYLKLASTPKEQNKIIFLTRNNIIAEYLSESGTLSAKEVGLPENASISAIFIYSQRLYTLDTANNQIYKHTPIQTGYDKGYPWIKDKNIALDDAVSLAIDGDLLVLKANGKIIRLVSGEQKDFNIFGLDPELDNPTKIWTYNNVQNIYILEPTNKRVIVLDKQGKLLQQYTSEIWQNPSSMIVDEASKVIYILDNNKVYRFGIE